METNNTQQKRTRTTPKVKWSDEAISKLSYRGHLQRLKVNIENPPIKNLYIRWTPTTNKKKLCFNYTFEKKKLRQSLGDFTPGVRGTKYYNKVINQLIDTHKDDDGNWLTDPREKVLSKQYILKSQRKTLRQVIRMYIEAECPRKNVKGNIDCDTAQTYARYLLGYNKRLTKLKFTNNRKGWGQIKLIRDDKMITWGDYWKTYGPGEHLDNSKNRNPREDRSVYDDDIGAMIIDDLTSGIIERYINTKSIGEGTKIKILNTFQGLWGFAHNKRLMGDTSPLDPTRRKYGGVSLLQDEESNTKNSQYNDESFSLDQLNRIEKEIRLYGKKKPFVAEALLWILYSGHRKSSTCKLKWEDIENFDDRENATITLRKEDNKNRASKKTIDEVIPITFLLRRVIRRLKVQLKRNPKYRWLPFLFPSGQVNWDKVNDPINYPGHKYSDECRLSERTLNDHWNKMRAITGIQGAIRTLRKSKDTHGIDKLGEVKMMFVMDRKSIEVQRRNYNKPKLDKKRKWANEVAEIYKFKTNEQ